MKKTLQLGMPVKHKEFAGMRGQPGIIVANGGNKYGIHYWEVQYINAETKTPRNTFFADFALLPL